MKNFIMSMVDKYVNLSYIYNKSKILLTSNKFALTLTDFYNKYINLKSYYNKFTYKLYNFFFRTINIFKKTSVLRVYLNKLKYPSILKKDKLIIRLENLEHVLIYLPLMGSYININISPKNEFIDLTSLNNDINYLTNLASLIKHSKKINKCTRVGMYYSTEKIIFKKKIRNDNKKK